MSLRVIESPLEMQQWSTLHQGHSLGFVPTMGALHQGHRTLLDRGRAENDFLILSIFVNPTQFNNKSDLEKYPRTWEQDLKVAENSGVDIVFAPAFDSMYPDQYRYKISENEFAFDLCGKDRPGHFDGVLSVVMKLFQLTRTTRAYFGEKDFQQLQLIKGMVEAFFLPIEIVAVPTVREQDGLALSSRNVRLTPEQRLLAPKIFAAISQSRSASEAQAMLQSSEFQIDYIKDLFGRRFAAVKLGDVRLIDNVKI